MTKAPVPCDHEWERERLVSAQFLVIYVCKKCGAEIEKDVS